jgi:hypothetical protein
MLIPCIDIRRDDYDFDLIRRMVGIWRRAAELMIAGDYYPLTPIHRAPDKWVARQFDCPGKGQGFIQAIRLPAAPEATLVVHPQGLIAGAVYRFDNPETGETRECTGRKAHEDGFAFKAQQRQGALWFYRAKEPSP